ncbi:hypothetical protein ASF21_05940 [Arthrobacter sp. Leaf234]|nr:hypothetical protein [Arthrobacter sp. Leaf234]KQO03774.1 hypothetical protein ASF21_05940 [Arthrobacter sp. Leaf234]
MQDALTIDLHEVGPPAGRRTGGGLGGGVPSRAGGWNEPLDRGHAPFRTCIPVDVHPRLAPGHDGGPPPQPELLLGEGQERRGDALPAHPGQDLELDVRCLQVVAQGIAGAGIADDPALHEESPAA